jgi:hypothetical protein
MTQLEIAYSIIDCIEKEKEYSKELPAEIALLKLKHELYALTSKIYKEIPYIPTP